MRHAHPEVFDWSVLDGMTGPEQVEHMKWLVEEMTTPPEGLLADLTRQESRIAGLLFKREGKVVTRDAILAAAMCDKPRSIDDWRAPKQVDVLVYRLRRKLVPRGYCIENVWGIGYRLTRKEAAA